MLCTYIGGVDYDSGPYNVTIPAGMREASFDISINNDIIVLEGNENFSLVIISSSLPVIFADEAVVTIVDDDG